MPRMDAENARHRNVEGRNEKEKNSAKKALKRREKENRKDGERKGGTSRKASTSGFVSHHPATGGGTGGWGVKGSQKGG